MSKRITIYFDDQEWSAVSQLTSTQMKILLVVGKELFAVLKETPDSKAMLNYNKKLAEAVELW